MTDTQRRHRIERIILQTPLRTRGQLMAGFDKSGGLLGIRGIGPTLGKQLATDLLTLSREAWAHAYPLIAQEGGIDNYGTTHTRQVDGYGREGE